MLLVARCALLALITGSVAGNAQASIVSERVSERNISTTLSANSSQIQLPGTVTTSTLGNGTCISRTINYITHTLPQQCLRTSRSSANGTSSTFGGPSLSAGNSSTGSRDKDEATTSSLHLAATSTSSGAAITIAEVVTHAEATSTTVTVLTGIPSPINSEVETASETDSPLDNANFMSFEEWRRQNLAKAGQSPEDLGQDRIRTGDRERPGINNALDTLGEESEIDLAFAGFGASQPDPSVAASSQSTASSPSEAPVIDQDSRTNLLRSRDAGKTCKERTNYASFDCAATVLKSNKECKSASSVLVENKDSYMLNICSAQNKFFIIELCNDILIDTVVLANYEFFSSIFRHFRVSVSDRYPVKLDKWKDLGTFEARNTREVQAFLIENPLIWARYLKVEFLTHWGSEYYCPVSLLRVHGKTMMQEFRQQEELARGEDDEEATLETEVFPVSPVAQEPLAATSEDRQKTVEKIETVESATVLPTGEPSTSNGNGGISSEPPLSTSTASSEHSANITQDTTHDISLDGRADATCAAVSSETGASSAMIPKSQDVGSVTTTAPTGQSPLPAESKELSNTSQSTSSESDHVSTSTSHNVASTSANASISHVEATAAPLPSSLNLNGTNSTSSSVNSSSSTVPSQNPTSSHISPHASPQTPINSTRNATPTSISASPQPSTQESFFKSISKRLQQLESNSTLSLQYIEEQSRILRDAFNKVEKRQISTTSTFLSHLNDTVMNELHGFRQAYDQLWQSTVIELEGQREQYQREMLALSTRLTLVADELVWQKRMGIVQSTLLLLCLALVLFTRQGNGYHLEVPLVQQMVNKSQAALRTTGSWDSHPNSPSSPASRSPVSLFRRKLWRSSLGGAENGHVSEGRSESRPRTGEGGLEVQLEPPTPPPRRETQSDGDEEAEDEEMVLQSGPATPNGTGEGLKRVPAWPGEMVDGI